MAYLSTAFRSTCLLLAFVAAGCGSTAPPPEKPIEPYFNYFASERQDAVYLFATLTAKARFERDPINMEFAPFIALNGRSVQIFIASPAATQPTTIPSSTDPEQVIQLYPLVDRIARAYELDTGLGIVPADAPGADLSDLLASEPDAETKAEAAEARDGEGGNAGGNAGGDGGGGG